MKPISYIAVIAFLIFAPYSGMAQNTTERTEASPSEIDIEHTVAGRPKINISVPDCYLVQENEKALQAATRGGRPICLDHFDQQLSQESWARPLLAHLEQLVYVDQRTVILLTSREPGALFSQSGEIEAEGDEEALRWIRLLGQFVKVGVADLKTEQTQRGLGTGGAESPEERGWGRMVRRVRAFYDRLRPPESTREERRIERLRKVLDYESRTHPALQEIVRHAERRERFHELTPDALLDQIREMADSYYHALWSILEREEKVVVAQLAAGAVVNPKSVRAIRRLLARKILVRRPELALMNASFARFVREEISMSTVAVWEREEPVSAWQRLRFPILLAVGAVAAFLFVTQRPTFDLVIAILSAAVVGTTAAVRLFGGVRIADGGG